MKPGVNTYMLDRVARELGGPAGRVLSQPKVQQEFFKLRFRSPEHVWAVAKGHVQPPGPEDLGSLDCNPKFRSGPVRPSRIPVLEQLAKFVDDPLGRFFGLVGDGAAEKQRIIFDYLFRRAPRQRTVYIDYANHADYADFIEHFAKVCLGEQPQPQDRYRKLADYVQKNPLLLILDNVDVYRSWNVDAYHAIRNDALTNFLLQVTAPPSLARIVLCVPVLPTDLTPYVGQDWSGHRAVVLADVAPEINRRPAKMVAPDPVSQGCRMLGELLKGRTISPAMLDCARVIFRNWTGDLEEAVQLTARRFLRRSLGGLVKLMLDTLPLKDRLLLGYIAVSEDGIEDRTMATILRRAFNVAPEEIDQERDAFLAALEEVVRRQPKNGHMESDVSAAFRRRILYQWEKAAGLNDRRHEDDGTFFDFAAKRRVHRLVASIALQRYANLEQGPTDHEDRVRIFQTTSHLLASIDPRKIGEWRYRPVQDPQAALATIGQAEDSDCLDFALYLLTEYLDPARRASPFLVNTDAVRLDLLTRVFYLGRSFPEAASGLNSAPLTLPRRLPFGAPVRPHRPDEEGYDRAHNELVRSLYGQIAQCALRTHRLALAKSAVETALEWPPRREHELADLEFQCLRLDILTAQGQLGPAALLAEEVDLDSKDAVKKVLKAWPEESLIEDRWAELTHFIRLQSRIGHLFLLRGQLRRAVRAVTDACQLLQDCPAIMTSYPTAGLASLSFRTADNTIVPRGLGAQVVLRTALREDASCQREKRDRPDWLVEALKLAELAAPEGNEPAADEAADITLDRYVRERQRMRTRVEELDQAHKRKPAGEQKGPAQYVDEELERFEERIRSWDERLRLRTLDSKVGPLPAMRLIQEQARNALFLSIHYRAAGAHTAANRNLQVALAVLKTLIRLAALRRYPLLLAEAMLMSVAAQKEEAKRRAAPEAPPAAKFAEEQERSSRIKEDHDRIYETLEAAGYRLRWHEYERAISRSTTGEFSLSDIDAQSFG